MTPGEVIGTVEIGGTHVTAALVSMEERTVVEGTMQRHDISADRTRDELVWRIVDAARRLARPEATLWSVATPGPFDYAAGISLVRGVDKLDALYGVNLRAELSDALGVQPRDVVFLNDADAFLIGEWWAGAARGHARAMGVTLGTGLGSAFLADGRIIETDPSVPPEGRLDLVPFRGAPVEDTLSRRGIRAAYGRDSSDVIEIARRAMLGEPRAAGVFHHFAVALGEFLTPWIERFAPTCVVFGGSIARSWDLWSEDFRAACPSDKGVQCGVAKHLEEAPLLGAAHHAQRMG